MEKMTVLIADDDPINLKRLEAMTNKVGNAKALCFSSPKEALKWCSHNEPDLVLVDT